MKKLFLILAVAAFGLAAIEAKAQDEAAAPQTEQTAVEPSAEAPTAPAIDPETEVPGKPLHQSIKEKFLEGGAGWMAPILIFLILGLAISIERILYLNLSTINSKKLIAKVEAALNKGGIEEAKKVTRDTKGPIASIFYQGLDRYDQGMVNVEKAVVSYGSVQIAQMESGLVWIGLFIALSPMLGFMGTVVGMVDAFDSIQAAGMK